MKKIGSTKLRHNNLSLKRKFHLSYSEAKDETNHETHIIMKMFGSSLGTKSKIQNF